MTVAAQTLVGRKGSVLETSLIDRIRDQVAEGSDAIMPVRREAMEWLVQHGLPSNRNEAWRNAPLADLLATSVGASPVSPPSAQSGGAELGAHALVDRLSGNESQEAVQLFIVNGIAMTDANPVPGVRCLPIAHAIEVDARVRERLGKLAKLENGFVAANTAGFSDGWCLLIDAGVNLEQPIEINVVTSGKPLDSASLSRILVIVGADSQLKLVERHWSQTNEFSLADVVTEIFLERGALLEHARWADLGSSSWSIATTAVQVAQDANYRSWSATARGRFVRHDLAVHLAGRRAKTDLDGLYFARSGELVEQFVRVWHEQPEGVTKECYRGIIENRGRGSFDGIIYVQRGAMQTDARQENRNLLLGPEAVVHTKPHLEIDADDVTCSHGATVGQLDEQQVFYLRSRGIDEGTAKEVLTWAFAKEIVDRCPNAALRRTVERSLHAVESSRIPAAAEGAE